MLRHAAALALAAGAATAALPSAGPTKPAAVSLAYINRPDPHHVLVIAHRSCWQRAPENSLAGVRACERLGVDGVELDVRHTRDGVAVIIHDETVDRTTDGQGRVSDLTWSQMSRLHLREGAGGAAAKVTKERVPTLLQYLAAARDRLLIVFDVKDWSQRSTFEAVARMRMERQAIFFYECDDDRLLKSVEPFRERVTLIPIMFEKDGPLADGLRRCPSNPSGWAHVKWRSAAWLDAAERASRDTGTSLWTATMFPDDNGALDDQRALDDPDAAWGRQVAASARMIMTNRPADLLAYLARSGARR